MGLIKLTRHKLNKASIMKIEKEIIIIKTREILSLKVSNQGQCQQKIVLMMALFKSKYKCVGKDGSELSMLCKVDGRAGVQASNISSLLAVTRGVCGVSSRLVTF